eukprot:1180352-Prorocentrum_minimum.AAC.7
MPAVTASDWSIRRILGYVDVTVETSRTPPSLLGTLFTGGGGLTPPPGCPTGGVTLSPPPSVDWGLASVPPHPETTGHTTELVNRTPPSTTSLRSAGSASSKSPPSIRDPEPLDQSRCEIWWGMFHRLHRDWLLVLGWLRTSMVSVPTSTEAESVAMYTVSDCCATVAVAVVTVSVVLSNPDTASEKVTVNNTGLDAVNEGEEVVITAVGAVVSNMKESELENRLGFPAGSVATSLGICTSMRPSAEGMTGGPRDGHVVRHKAHHGAREVRKHLSEGGRKGVGRGLEGGRKKIRRGFIGQV